MYDFFLGEKENLKHVTVYEYHDVLNNECDIKDYSLIYNDEYGKSFEWCDAYMKIKDNVKGMYFNPKTKNLETRSIWILSSNKSDDDQLYFAIYHDKSFAYINHELKEVSREE